MVQKMGHQYYHDMKIDTRQSKACQITHSLLRDTNAKGMIFDGSILTRFLKYVERIHVQ